MTLADSPTFTLSPEEREKFNKGIMESVGDITELTKILDTLRSNEDENG
jgi:hypothetical protein